MSHLIYLSVTLEISPLSYIVSRVISMVSSACRITLNVIMRAPPLFPLPYRCNGHTHLASTATQISSLQRFICEFFLESNKIVLQRRVLFCKAFKLAFKFIAQNNLDFHTFSSASSSLMKSSALCSLRPSRRAWFISSNALSSDSFTYACWRSDFLLVSPLVLSTVVDTTPRSNSIALRTCNVVASSFNVTNICVIIVIFFVSGGKYTKKTVNQNSFSKIFFTFAAK